MSPIRVLGSALSLLSGALAVYVHFYGALASVNPPTVWLAVAGGVLVGDSLVSFAGVRLSFGVGALLSALVAALVALQWSAYVATDAEAAVVLSVICAILDAVASRPARGLSEKDSPLNLPVFG